MFRCIWLEHIEIVNHNNHRIGITQTPLAYWPMVNGHVQIIVGNPTWLRYKIELELRAVWIIVSILVICGNICLFHLLGH